MVTLEACVVISTSVFTDGTALLTILRHGWLSEVAKHSSRSGVNTKAIAETT